MTFDWAQDGEAMEGGAMSWLLEDQDTGQRRGNPTLPTVSCSKVSLSVRRKRLQVRRCCNFTPHSTCATVGASGCA